MKFLFSLFLTATYLLSFTQAEKLRNSFWVKEQDVSTFLACKYAVTSQALYCASDSTKRYTCQCQDVVAQGAFVYCGVQETKNKTVGMKRFLKNYNSKCSSSNVTFTMEDLYTIYDNATKYIETAKEYGSYSVKKDVLRTPLIYNHTLYESAYKTYYISYGNLSTAIITGLAQVAWWFFVALIGASHQILARLFPSFGSNALLQRVMNDVWFKSYKQPIKLFGFELGFIPNKLESVVLAGSFVLFMIGSFGLYEYNPNSINLTGKQYQLTAYIADRTGYLACFAMNLTFLFGGRNNFFLWATGWNFSGYMIYHKFVARWTVLLVFAHSMAFVWISVKQGKYRGRIRQEYWIWGSVATTCGMVMLPFSSQFFRRKVYDIFVFFHILLALFFLIGTWYHLIDFNLQYYCYATIGIWSLDRILRVFRMFVLFGGFRKNKVTIIRNPLNKEITGEEVDKDDLFFRIDVDNYNKSLFKIKDGNFSFVYILHPRGFWQSHPFTIVKLKESENFTIVIKAKKGLTKHIYNSIAKSGSDSKYFRVCVEGPYGMTKSDVVSQFDNFAAVVVGTGISGPLCYMNHHRNSVFDEKNSKPNVIHWGVKSLAVVESYKEELTQLLSHGNIKVNVYCNRLKGYNSRQSSNIPSSESVSEDKDETLGVSSINSITNTILGLDNLELITEYMSVDQIVGDEMNQSCSLAIMTCGLPAICDETRYHYLKTLKSKKNGRYQFIDDAQVW
ncbi:hypothetical protein ACO0SA_004697 [Hanseniaspora valbyensis]